MPRTTASGLDTKARIFSVLERDLIHERTMDGLTAAAAQGRYSGRPPAVDDDQPQTPR
jgi:DNA invertase Pin-like site-specific DNA recombinase